MKDYLEHYFPVILHVAYPTRLDAELRKKLNSFLPVYRKALEEVVESKGRRKTDYRFLNPHDMAVILLPSKFILALGLNNKSMFLTGFYCFELQSDVDRSVISRILENSFNLKDCYYYEFDRKLLEEVNQEEIELKAQEYEGLEYQLIRKGESLLNISPKVFKNMNIEVKENYCFVLMPFREDLKEIYDDCIRVAVTNCGMSCERADDIFHNNSIMEVIWTKICSAEIVIADLTGKNPNVFYEVGIAHTLGKEVIMLTQDSEDVPFDLRHLKYIQYSITKRGQEKLIEDLSLTIKSIKGMLGEIGSHS